MGVLSFFRRTQEARKELQLHRLRLYRIAYAWTHNPALADDLVQETLTKALQKSDQLRDAKASEAWLYTILANCFRDHFRRQRETEEVNEDKLVQESTPEDVSSEYEIVTKVRQAIGKLSEGQRQVVTLVDIEGFSYVEVSNILEIPIGTVMSRLCRARNALKQHLDSGMPSETAKQGVKLRRIK
jgi:RNA polymerase sigma-70 factor, ECF subfamily